MIEVTELRVYISCSDLDVFKIALPAGSARNTPIDLIMYSCMKIYSKQIVSRLEQSEHKS